MKKGRLIWGIICLALAGLLTVLNLVLPEGHITFMVNDTNMPYVPPIVLGILGIVLLSNVKAGNKETAKEEPPTAENQEKIALNKRLETIGWGCFLLMLGGFLFVPHLIVAGGIWSIGVGAIMLGLNIARYFYRIKLSGVTTFLGILSIAVGIAHLLGIKTLEGASFLIILGAYLVLKPWFDKRQLFGKVEKS